MLDLPPNETGQELTGADAMAAMHEALLAITGEPKVHLTLKDLGARAAGRWVVLRLSYHGPHPENDVTIRISREWADRLRQALDEVRR